jgi:phenylalanyl-tRNA synthetase beta chain
MKFSINLAQEFSNVDLKFIPHDEILARMGAQLGAIEDKTDYSSRYSGILVVRVVSCEKHPDADKLNVCFIDDGGVADVERNAEGYVQVVCGANNVVSDIYVAWIPPGATVPSTIDTDPFVLEARDLRGKTSNGMLASPRELGISDEHEGILILNETELGRKPTEGENFYGYYGLDDYVVDCENKMFTHRPDCFGNLGIARELAGIFDLEFKSPEWYIQNPEFTTASNIELAIENNISQLVPRFTVVALENISNNSSPIWMQSLLKRVGIKPISAVVDITNYVMHLTGQPLHAFDYDKIISFSDNAGIHPRKAVKGEKIKLLGGKEIELHEDDLVIATDKQAVALAGVMGGEETEVDENTKRIIIECANFDMYTIRRTSMRHGLFTDAVTRFNKGQSPLQNAAIINYAVKLLSEITGATQASNVYDLADFDLSADNLNHVAVTTTFINSRLGSELSASDIKTLLENVEFKVGVQGESLEITVPFWRMDISIAEDIVEEVGRLYGFDKLTVELPLKSSKPTQKNEILEFNNQLRNKLSKTGASEVLTYSFVHGDLLEKVGIDANKWTYHLRNALSPDLQYYRPSLTPSLLAKVHSNLKAQAGSNENIFALFEIGKSHVRGENDLVDTNLPKQMRRLSFVIAGDDKISKNINGSAYYQAKKYVELITNSQVQFEPLDTNEYPITAPYQQKRSAVILIGHGAQQIGVIGEFRPSVKKSLKLPEYCAGFELDIDLLKKYLKQKEYQKLSQYPSSTQDITFEVSKDTNWDVIDKLIDAELAVASAELGYEYLVEPLDIFSQEDSDKKRISFRISMNHHNKTLKTTEVNDLLEQIAKVVHGELQATRI